MLVPYEASAGRSFDDYLRRGGRANPIPISARSGIGVARDLEGQLLDERSMRKEDDISLKILKASHRQARVTQCAILVVLSVFLAVAGGLGYVAMQANDGINAANAMIRPHAALIVNTTMGALKDAGGSMHNIETITRMTSALAQQDLGPAGSASRAMNSTAVIAQRLAEFMAHPTIQLSLGGMR
jgi:hypothetical protein